MNKSKLSILVSLLSLTLSLRAKTRFNSIKKRSTTRRKKCPHTTRMRLDMVRQDLKPNLRMNSSKSCELESRLTKNSPCMI